MEASRTYEFMSDDWLAGVRAVFEQRAGDVAASAGPERLTVQERYTVDGGGAGSGWFCTFADGQVVDFGRGEAASADMSSTTPWQVARRLASTVLAADSETIAAYAADQNTHVRRTITCDPARVQGLATALADAHDAIARFTAPAHEEQPR